MRIASVNSSIVEEFGSAHRPRHRVAIASISTAGSTGRARTVTASPSPAVDAHRIIRDRRPQRQTRQFLKPFGGTASRPTWRQLDWDMLRGGRHNWASISGSVALERFQNEKKLLSKHGRNPRCGRFSICRNGLLGIQSPVRDRST
jgi:hypothetical protein